MSDTAGSDRPIILLHGWTMRGAVFDRLAKQLGRNVQAPDLPGHGAATQGDVGLGGCVDMLDTLVKGTGRDDVLLVGWSMGALVAWAYIAAHGIDRLAGLVTVDMSPCPANGQGWELGLRGSNPERLKATTREIHGDWPTAAGKIATTMFAKPSGAPGFDRDAALDQIMSNDAEVMARYWDEMMAMDLRAVVSRIDIPWLVTHGAQSRVYPGETARWLAATAPRAQMTTFAQSGHSPHLEEPDEFARVLAGFEARL